MSELNIFDDWNEDLVLTEDESNSLITNLKDELILENILEQIENPFSNLNNQTDYLELFKIRYNYLYFNYNTSTDFIKKLNDIRDEMYITIFKSITKKFNISYSSDLIDINECAENLYYFFILGYKNNIISFFFNNIIKEKKNLATSVINTVKDAKNATSIALKKILKNKEDAIIIPNINLVINTIIENSNDNLEVIKNICENDLEEVSNYKINQYFINDFSLCPEKDFIEIFFRPIKEKYEGYSFIINDLKTKLMNTAPKKNKN